MNPIILNIGIEKCEATASLTSCSVWLSRNTESGNDDYDVQLLQAEDQPLTAEEWKSPDASRVMECLCLALEIEPGWEGEAQLEVLTEAGKFQTPVHLHAGLNSFFLSAKRLQPLKKKRLLTGISGKIWIWLAIAFITLTLCTAIYYIVKGMDNESQNVTAVDSLKDSVADSISQPADTLPATQSEDPEIFPNASTPSYSGNYLPYNDFTDTVSDEEIKAEPPRRENNYGIEE